VRGCAFTAAKALFPPGEGKVGAGLKLRLFLENARPDAAESHFSWRRIFPAGPLHAIARPELHDPGFEERYYARIHDLIPRGRRLDPLNLLMYLDVRAYLADDMLTKVDRASMKHSLEVRVPFLDHRLVEWSMSVPGRAKLTSFRTKTLLRDALRGRVPEPVRRLRKAGFNAPLPHWFRAGCGTLLESLISSRTASCSAHLQLDEVRRLLAEHRTGGADHSHKLWSALTLAIWDDEVLRPS
jgi:asparagine synthase (glutamine-hydrolysing)